MDAWGNGSVRGLLSIGTPLLVLAPHPGIGPTRVWIAGRMIWPWIWPGAGSWLVTVIWLVFGRVLADMLVGKVGGAGEALGRRVL